MLSTTDIPLSESALLVVDAQDSFKVDPKWERRNNRNFERNVGALIDAYRAAGRPVIFFLHTDGDPGFERDSVHLRLMDFITVRDGEPVILKDTRNTFTGTTLQAKLLALGVRRLAITGIQMEQCCETTARVAADLGYAVDFVDDVDLATPGLLANRGYKVVYLTQPLGPDTPVIDLPPLISFSSSVAM